MLLVNKEHLEDEVLKSIQKKAESIMPKDAKVILFGSRARRDAKADSDWDILVLLNKDKIDEQDHDNYTYPLWELGWQINQMIHPIVYSMKDWNSKKGSPFYNNVEEEGVMLLQNSGTPCFTLIEQALSVFLTLIMFNDPWVLPDEVCVIVFTFFHEGEYDP